MSWKDYSRTVARIKEKKKSDGLGGYEIERVKDIEFLGTLNIANTTEVLKAEKEGMTANYVLLFSNDVELYYGDILLIEDRYFKVCTNPKDGIPPVRSRMDFIQVKLELQTMI